MSSSMQHMKQQLYHPGRIASSTQFRRSYSSKIYSRTSDSFYQQPNGQKQSSIKLVYANNLKELTFHYDGVHNHTLNNYQLKIKNESVRHQKVFVKIKSNSPSHYEVRPKSGVLEYGQILSVSIELKLHIQDISQVLMKHDLSRYRNDKIKVCFVAMTGRNRHSNEINGNLNSKLCINSTQNPNANQSISLAENNASVPEEGENVFPVLIEQSEEERGRYDDSSNQKCSENAKLEIEREEMKVYEDKIMQNSNKVEEISQRIKANQQVSSYSSYLTSNLIGTVGLIGIVLGFWAAN